jgi:hypothetical protein
MYRSVDMCFCWFCADLTPLPWRWRRYVPPKRRALAELHGITTQNAVRFIITAVITPKPAQYWCHL